MKLVQGIEVRGDFQPSETLALHVVPCPLASDANCRVMGPTAILVSVSMLTAIVGALAATHSPNVSLLPALLGP